MMQCRCSLLLRTLYFLPSPTLKKIKTVVSYSLTSQFIQPPFKQISHFYSTLQAKSMASVSTSYIPKSFKYDVFLSFCGEDTRKNFVDHLYHALKQKGINTYRDDEEIKKGQRIGKELMRSIEDSRFYIIVFSKNYASSSWCLDELVKIIKCQKTNERTAYPVFYDVEPTEVRKQSGAVGQAFAKHKDDKSAGKWTKALKRAADLAGWELKNTLNGNEAMFIRKIVKDISVDLRFIDWKADPKLVGMKARVKNVVSSLETDIDDVRMIGIKGIGGGGKTTLAKTVFDQVSILYEGSSFVENVREISKGSPDGLKLLQKQLLSDVLNDSDITVNGVSMLKRLMSGRKVLVVLDDVDHIDQLEALAGETNWFKPGSRIIITSRDEQVLVAHGVSKSLILDVDLLSREESICLFNRYAFGTEVPNQDYKMLSDQVCRYANGLPLTIKVLGSFLRGKDELEWTDALERLEKIPLKETLEILELSYNSLEEDYREIFLDVACMLKGWEKEKAIRVLESCGFHARSGLKVLVQKSLVTVSDSGHLSMHDHLEEMGKNIVRRVHPNEPSKHSRLWIEEEISDILAGDKGTKATRCIRVWWGHLVSVMKALQKMENLRFLQVEGGYTSSHFSCNEDGLCLPNGLQYLLWQYYPFTCLPKSFQANNLVGLEMRFSSLKQLWKGGETKVLKKLKYIDLCNCELRTLDINLIQNLERLNLEECPHLVELHMPTICFKLKFLSIHNCKLKTLDLAQAWNLVTLSVGRCKDLVELHMPIESLKFKSIHLRLLKLKTLNVTGTPNLELLGLEECEHMEDLHMRVEMLKLKRLVLLRCSKLKTLDLTRTPNLEELDLKECEDLVELRMHAVLKLKHLMLHLCSKLKTINLRMAPTLEGLDVTECENVVELRIHLETLKLKHITLIRCSKLKTLNLTGALNLNALTLEKCEDLVDLYMPVEMLKLERLKLFRCSKLKALNLKGSPNLKVLEVIECENLVELQMHVETLKLKDLTFVRCSKLKALNLRGAPSLEVLYITECENLEKVHMPAEMLKLEHLMLLKCLKLKSLNLSGTPNLELLDLEESKDLEELHLPVEMLKLECLTLFRCSKLKTLNLTGTPNLKELHMEECEELEELHILDKMLKLEYLMLHRFSKLTGTLNLKAWDHVERLMLKHLSLECSKSRTFNLGLSPNLLTVHLKECNNLVEIYAPIRRLQNRVVITSSGCVRFNPFVVNQGSPMVLAELNLVMRSMCIKCRSHPDNNLHDLKFDCVYKEPLPSLTGNLCKRIVVDLYTCTNPASFLGRNCGLEFLRKLTLEGSILEVPIELDQLECLEELSLFSSWTKHLPNSICMLKHLKSLKLKSCWKLEQLPVDIGRLECLEELHVTDCKSLQDVPASICMLKRLKSLKLKSCWQLEQLPENLGRLESLEELRLMDCKSLLYVPSSICEMNNLRLLKLKSCLLLKQLPEDLGRLECLEELNITECESLKDIPSSICEMKRLKRFNLKKCALVKKLPEIGHVKSLKVLNTKGTRISDVQQSIFRVDDQFFRVHSVS